MVKPFSSLLPEERSFFVKVFDFVMRKERPYRMWWPRTVINSNILENLESSYYTITTSKGSFSLYADVLPTPAGYLEAHKWAEINRERVEYILALQGDQL